MNTSSNAQTLPASQAVTQAGSLVSSVLCFTLSSKQHRCSCKQDVLVCADVAQGRADQSCQPGASFKPFLIHAVLPKQGRPKVIGHSNYSWCPTRTSQAMVGQVVMDMASLSTNGQVLPVESKEATQLLMLSQQTHPNAGLYPQYFPRTEGEAQRTADALSQNAGPGIQ